MCADSWKTVTGRLGGFCCQQMRRVQFPPWEKDLGACGGHSHSGCLSHVVPSLTGRGELQAAEDGAPHGFHVDRIHAQNRPAPANRRGPPAKLTDTLSASSFLLPFYLLVVTWSQKNRKGGKMLLWETTCLLLYLSRSSLSLLRKKARDPKYNLEKIKSEAESRVFLRTQNILIAYKP